MVNHKKLMPVNGTTHYTDESNGLDLYPHQLEHRQLFQP